jgi:hypothetical protein
MGVSVISEDVPQPLGEASRCEFPFVLRLTQVAEAKVRRVTRAEEVPSVADRRHKSALPATAAIQYRTRNSVS